MRGREAQGRSFVERLTEVCDTLRFPPSNASFYGR